MNNNEDIEINISKVKVLCYLLLAGLLITIGVTGIIAGSGSLSLLVLILGVYFVFCDLPYLVKINQPYLAIDRNKLSYIHWFLRKKIALNDIATIKMKTDCDNIGNPAYNIPVKIYLCLIQIKLKNGQVIVLYPSLVGKISDFTTFKKDMDLID